MKQNIFNVFVIVTICLTIYGGVSYILHSWFDKPHVTFCIVKSPETYSRYSDNEHTKLLYSDGAMYMISDGNQEIGLAGDCNTTMTVGVQN